MEFRQFEDKYNPARSAYLAKDWDSAERGFIAAVGGIERTEGPTPPDFVLPRTTTSIRNLPGTWTYLVIHELTDKTGVAYETIERRLWVNIVPSIVHGI